MNKDFASKKRPSGSEKKEPRVKNLLSNTELCVDLKTYLRYDRRALLGKEYSGVITHDFDEHYTFVEIPSMSSNRRNPHVFNGRYITITRRNDGTLNLNFKRLPDRHGFNITSYSVGVSLELQKALNGLVEKKMTRKKTYTYQSQISVSVEKKVIS